TTGLVSESQVPAQSNPLFAICRCGSLEAKVIVSEKTGFPAALSASAASPITCPEVSEMEGFGNSRTVATVLELLLELLLLLPPPQPAITRTNAIVMTNPARERPFKTWFIKVRCDLYIYDVIRRGPAAAAHRVRATTGWRRAAKLGWG